MVKVSITHSVLKWARETSNMTIDEVAQKMGKKSEIIRSWEEGIEKPTYIQLEKLAYQIYKRPIAIFFFPEAPAIKDPKKEFRTFPDFEYENIPYTVMRIFRKAQAMQLNLDELYDGNNPAEEMILKSISISEDVEIDHLINEVRDLLDVNLDEQLEWGDAILALKHWRETFENNGIFVFKDAFNYDKISGFCLYNKEFPIIYLNNSMPETRQIFTLFHELAHLIFGVGGIDTLDDRFLGRLSPGDKQIEVFCNEFAGKFLVPDNHFDSQIYGCEINEEVISSLAKRYSVSREVILRKLLDRNIIDRRFYQEKAEEWIEIAKESRRRGGGGNYYYKKISYLGNQYLNKVLEKYYTKKIDVHQVSDYLDIKINKIPTLEAYYMGG